MKNEWDVEAGQRNAQEDDQDEKDFPRVRKNNKSSCAEAICAVKKILIKADPRWEQDTREKILSEIDERNVAAGIQVQMRLDRVRESNFSIWLWTARALLQRIRRDKDWVGIKPESPMTQQRQKMPGAGVHS